MFGLSDDSLGLASTSIRKAVVELRSLLRSLLHLDFFGADRQDSGNSPRREQGDPEKFGFELKISDPLRRRRTILNLDEAKRESNDHKVENQVGVPTKFEASKPKEYQVIMPTGERIASKTSIEHGGSSSVIHPGSPEKLTEKEKSSLQRLSQDEVIGRPSPQKPSFFRKISKI